MNIGAPTLLASYAYQQAGGGSAGVSAALASLASSANDVATMVRKTGLGQEFDLLQLSNTKALDVGTYDLQVAAGKGPQVVQNLINPPAGYANPLLTQQTVLNPNVVGAYTKYQYGEAKKAGQTNAFTLQTTGTAAEATQGFQGDLYNSAMPPSKTFKANALAFFDPMDVNQDGFISPAETISYALENPQLDPMDANLDGVVSPAEELVYSLSHPGSQYLKNLGLGNFLDIIA